MSSVMDEVVSIEFVKLVENTSDVITKNQQSVHFKSAQPNYTIGDMEKEQEKVRDYYQEGC